MKLLNKIILPALLLVVVGLITWHSLKNRELLPPQHTLEYALQLAGKNRSELEKVLEHYSRDKNDSLKLRAAKFLIMNCVYHESQSSHFEDSQGNEIRFFPPDYKTSAEAYSVRNSLFSHAKCISEVNPDWRVISYDYLTRHIDAMFSVWQSTKWRKQVGFDRFCQYLLPYRASAEPISSWAAALNQKYRSCIDTATGIIDNAKAINHALAGDIKYNPCWSASISIQSVPDMFTSEGGMCDDLAMYSVCAMRACGIPATIDFTIWARMNKGHCWGVVFDEQGKAVSFGAGEQDPGEHIKVFSWKYHNLAKVFRTTFQPDETGLWARVKDIYSIPELFRQKNVMDVTSEYVPVYDIVLPIDNSLLTSDSLCYLCVYNVKKWVPVQWALVNNGKAVFTDMGSDIVYMPAKYEKGLLSPLSVPFIFDSDQQIKYLDGNGPGNQTVRIEKIIRGIGGGIKTKQKYQLFRWENQDWEFVREIEVLPDTSIIVNNLTSGYLYRFENGSRTFTAENNEICWW